MIPSASRVRYHLQDIPGPFSEWNGEWSLRSDEVSPLRRDATSGSFCGLLTLNKRAGLTSRAVVDGVDRQLRGTKIGHAGTLGPMAAGVLVGCVGAATRLIEFVPR